jgi:hypothetical protein
MGWESPKLFFDSLSIQTDSRFKSLLPLILKLNDAFRYRHIGDDEHSGRWQRTQIALI